MKNMTNKEIRLLGEDLNKAKILVLNKHGFTCEEIANVMNIPESVIRRLITETNTSN